MRRTMIGGEVYRYVSLVKRVRESFRRKKMTSGAAGREQNERRAARSHQILLPATAKSGALMAARGCSRVSASNMPIAYASEIIEEPP